MFGSEVPKRIANFEIIREIGRGGMGMVYLAKQVPIGREIAMKILPAQGDNSSEEYKEAMGRFKSEAMTVSKLEHENIVRLYDYGFAKGMHYLAMQYINGYSLYDIIQKRKPLPIETVIEYAKQICRGLNYADQKGVIHRDIKPQNILVSKEDGKCRIVDFGIAKFKRDGRRTMVGIAIGTPEYMSPEQAEGKNLDHQTDVYSLGILIYEMCTGNPPFYGGDPVGIAYRQVNEQPKNPSKLRHDIPVRLELIILKAIKKNKNERYRNTGEILKDLDTVISEGKDSIFDDYEIKASAKYSFRNDVLGGGYDSMSDVYDRNGDNGNVRGFVGNNQTTILIWMIALVSSLFGAIVILLVILLQQVR
ncbi:MAG: serine/threonine protein kinase [Chitinispirillales bacterium]|nr:serine/threonine protein kinase [Chitinispirillales bacterium]